MIKKELILKDPLKFLGHETDEFIQAGGFGAVIARAGVGKTAFLVQVALSALLSEKKVLHISLKDPVEKVNLWYKEMFQNITKPYDAKQKKQLWEDLLTHRFIMTFETETFDFKKLNKRVAELNAQNIFIPQIIIIDGVFFDKSLLPDLVALKAASRANRQTIWFSVRTHRHKAAPDPDRLLRHPEDGPDNLFDIIIQIVPGKKQIQLKIFSHTQKASTKPPKLFLDPSTMLILEDYVK